MQDRDFGKENMSFEDLGRLLGVIEIQIVLACLWRSIRCIVTSSLLCELSHTLSPYA
jgi:hypothetical protein